VAIQAFSLRSSFFFLLEIFVGNQISQKTRGLCARILGERRAAAQHARASLAPAPCAPAEPRLPLPRTVCASRGHLASWLPAAATALPTCRERWCVQSRGGGAPLLGSPRACACGSAGKSTAPARALFAPSPRAPAPRKMSAPPPRSHTAHRPARSAETTAQMSQTLKVRPMLPYIDFSAAFLQSHVTIRAVVEQPTPGICSRLVLGYCARRADVRGSANST
jgi:hypothetical protein